ncbi:MAG: carboxynorspermidine decarboxylase [Syntrophobacteraceae bacterium]|nr:carboxynorspermidine decarboxylase [Syntrophobacteraceae bacterium]
MSGPNPCAWALGVDWSGVDTPAYVVDEGALERNLEILGSVQDRTGCRIILALKGFAMFSLFGQIRRHLHGIAASSLDEARLGREELGKEVHVFSPGYRESELDELLGYADHMVFNSFSQWDRFKPVIARSGRDVRCGMRVNPEHSEVKVSLYDPCGPGSRLGVTRRSFRGGDLDGLSGLHFHNLCELNADSLVRTLAAFEERFGQFLDRMEWVNFGGGHHITRPDYDVDLLCRTVGDFMQRRGLEVYLEPGEAVALNTGVLVTRVVDLVHNDVDIAILDTSAAAHMPDVLEMPYRPRVAGAGEPGEHPHTFRLGGLTCLAGDVIGDYSFPEPLRVGSPVVFLDMAHYTMVKNNTFNGVRLPSIAIRQTDGTIRVVRRFGYEDYRNRLS